MIAFKSPQGFSPYISARIGRRFTADFANYLDYIGYLCTKLTTFNQENHYSTNRYLYFYYHLN